MFSGVGGRLFAEEFRAPVGRKWRGAIIDLVRYAAAAVEHEVSGNVQQESVDGVAS